MENRFKFRVWDKEKKKMYYNVFLSEYNIKDSLGLNIGEIKNFIIMQSIGLKDKNKKDIFKSDLIEFTNTASELKFLCKVVYNAPAYELEIIKVLEDKKNRYKNVSLKGQIAAFSMGEEELIYEIVGNEFELKIVKKNNNNKGK